MAWNEVDQKDLAAVCLHDFVADNLFTRVVGAFDEDLGTQALDQFEGRVLFEHDDGVDCFKRGEYFGAIADGIDRPAIALQPCRRGIAVQPNHQPIAGRPGLRQKPDVTAMQEIETAIGEADAQALPA